ncbi:ribonuclease D [Gordonia sp. (in: high G+C Gram-positive bacteria)]|uniref:ribonuclease D n=1 Tax=Gordonia sp. (in: high G+C Gram-positive bacteria) TaxID=84139 RepID=UPI0016B46920|nr:ribonuclease D [Gordonia sp. (in: high G+C Gram-positive bacteria)]NLG48341.1 ribonuclease D [Gordonia sp. (in: high G+C Gram-positive bacteria)]
MTESADPVQESDTVLLAAPRDGVPPVLTTPDEFAEAAALLAAGTGPVALDTERASGYRYSQRAYLVQIKRTGSGSFLIDPIEHPDALEPVIEALAGPEWILHAADQDLPCLRDLGFHTDALFDTELAGRLLNIPKVNLAAMVAEFLNLGLAKGHGAADWSRRPLPDEWLNYAALDVEVLVELRAAIQQALVDSGRDEWAAQEFAAVLARPPAAPRTDRWRRTSQIHNLRTTRQLAVVRELWTTREEVARRRDIAPGRILPDSAIVTAATANPTTVQALTKLPVFGGPRQRRQADRWMSAIARAQQLPDSELPTKKTPQTGPPPYNRWDQRNPEAAARANAVRPVVRDLADEIGLPQENLVAPDVVRTLCWDGLAGLPADQWLADHGARPWQRELVAEPITEALG